MFTKTDKALLAAVIILVVASAIMAVTALKKVSDDIERAIAPIEQKGLKSVVLPLWEGKGQ